MRSGSLWLRATTLALGLAGCGGNAGPAPAASVPAKEPLAPAHPGGARSSGPSSTRAGTSDALPADTRKQAAADQAESQRLREEYQADLNEAARERQATTAPATHP